MSVGQDYVTGLINAVMQGPEWRVDRDLPGVGRLGRVLRPRDPAAVDENGYGLRVPGLVISPYARKGYIDHQTLSFDAYVKFIEDDFLHGQRLDPKTDGRPDPRPDVRENVRILGNLIKDFDFSQPPRRPLILPEHPVPAATPPAVGRYVAGALTAVSPTTVTLQVTATGPRDTNLQGQVLTVALTAKTQITLNGTTAPASALAVGQAVSLRIVRVAVGWQANQVDARSS